MPYSLAHQLPGLVFAFFSFSFPFFYLSFPSIFFLKIWVCVSEKQILSYLLEILYEFLVAAVANYYKLGGWNQLEYTFSFLESRSLKSVPSAGNGGVRRWQQGLLRENLASFSLWWSVTWKLLCRVRLFATPWTLVHGILQARILEWVAFPLGLMAFLELCPYHSSLCLCSHTIAPFVPLVFVSPVMAFRALLDIPG